MVAFLGGLKKKEKKKKQFKYFSSRLLSWYFEILDKSFRTSLALSFKTSVKWTSSLKLALKQQLMGMLNIKILLWGTDLYSKANHIGI